MMKYLIYFSITILIICLFSCEKEIDLKLNTAPSKYVIEAFIEPSKPAVVTISESNGYYDTTPLKIIDNAKITLSDNLGNVETLEYIKQSADIGLYSSQIIKGQAGTTYDLSITIDDNVFTASSTMPEIVEIGNMYMYYVSGIERAYPVVAFQDPKGIVNYYRHTLYVNGVRTSIGNSTTDDKNRDGFILERLLLATKDDLEEEKINKGDTIYSELICIDKGVYDFFYSLGNQSMNQTNPTTNIKGGALGYFSAQARSSEKIIADWE